MTKKISDKELDSVLSPTLYDEKKSKKEDRSISFLTKKSQEKSTKRQNMLMLHLFMPFELKSFLELIAFKTMKGRSIQPKNKNRERITPNTIVRALATVLKKYEKQIDLSEINNEEELTKRLMDCLRPPTE